MTTRTRNLRKADPARLQEPSAARPMLDLRLESPSFVNGGRIPATYAADGQNISPALTWASLPKETRALALLCEDPDAPGPTPFIHWLVADIDPQQVGSMIEQGAGSFPNATLGRNSFGRLGYDGPEPPKGSGVHHYHFRLYALVVPLGLKEGFGKEALMDALRGRLLGTGEIVGTYER